MTVVGTTLRCNISKDFGTATLASLRKLMHMYRIEPAMMVTDKVFFASTLLKTIGCSPATFRSWRNRNGLFPETKDSGGWNKFSVIDVLMAAIVFELTQAGIGAQLAVDAAMRSAPEITRLYGTPKSDEHSDLGAVVLRLLGVLPMNEFPVLEITNPNRASVSVRLIQPKE